MAETVDKAPWPAAPVLRASDDGIRQVPLRVEPESRLFPYVEGGAVGVEQFRLLQARLSQEQSAGRLRRLMVTSAVSGEGKTRVAANLALVMAQESDGKVLLVDADLRRPQVHEVYGIENDYGLSDVLRRGTGAGPGICRLRDTNLYVLPGGAPTRQPLGDLQLSSLKALLEEASSAFDLVILDTPPLLLVADATVLAASADGILLVARAQVTPRELLLKAKGLVDPAKILGIVLVGLDPMGLYGYRYQNLYQDYLNGTVRAGTPSVLGGSRK